jgi:hypothetical protein
MSGVGIAWIIIIALLWVILSWGAADTAARKGQSFVAVFVLSLIFSPVLGWLVAVLAANQSQTPPSEQGEGDRIGELERLTQLRTSGAVTEEEFAAEKARILGPPHDEPDTPAT